MLHLFLHNFGLADSQVRSLGKTEKEQQFSDFSSLSVILLMAEILHQLRLVVFPIIYRVSYIPGGAGFQPSTVGKYETTNLFHVAEINDNSC